jgi:hypothetical protein
MQNHITTFDTSVFEVVNGQINLTKICQHFHKRLDVWLKTKQTKAFLASYSVLTPNGGITVNIGNNGKEQGTFGNREIALKLAQWISPDFEVFCIQKLDELFQTGKTELKPTKELTTIEILELTTNEIKRLKSQLETTTKALEYKQSIIVDMAEKVPAKTMRAVINQSVRNYHEKTHLAYSYIWNNLYTEFKYVYHIDLEARVKGTKTSKIAMAEKIGVLEDLYLLTLKMYETERRWCNDLLPHKIKPC